MELKQTGSGRYGFFGRQTLAFLVLFLLVFSVPSSNFRKSEVLIDPKTVISSNFFLKQVKPETLKNSSPSLQETKISLIFNRQDKRFLFDVSGNPVFNKTIVQAYSKSFIYETPNLDLNLETFRQAQTTKGQKMRQLPLDDLIPRPKNPDPAKTNLLLYPKYNIRAPIIYTTAADFYHTNPDGSIDFNRPIYRPDMSPYEKTQIPIQIKLRDGVVHLTEEVYPYSVMPGEIGNSYIVGHSSNYSWVKSNYNEIFKPLEKRTQVGEEFIIYDKYGRELKFKVFETILIEESDTATAFKLFEGRRVVTLQTSVLTWRGGVLIPTHRWLTRGELLLDI